MRPASRALSIARFGARMVVVCAALCVVLESRSQPGDVFASSAQSRPFAHLIESYPACASHVYDYWDLTDQIYVIGEQRRHAVEPEAGELVAQMNDVAKERSDVATELHDCVEQAVESQRAPLKGKVTEQVLEDGASQTTLQGGVEKNAPQEPVVLREEVPKLDPREPPRGQPPGAGPNGQGGTHSTTSTEVIGVLLPRDNPSGSGPPAGPGGNGSGGPGGPGGSEPGGTGPGGTTQVETDVRGELLKRTTVPGAPGEGGTKVNDVTRVYIHLQGLQQGLLDVGPDVGGKMGQTMIAIYYGVLKRDPQKARDWLGLKPGESVLVTQLEREVKEWGDVFAADPNEQDPQKIFDNARRMGKKIGDAWLEKFGPDPFKKFGPEIPGFPQDVPGVTSPIPVPDITQPPDPRTGAPNARKTP